MRASSHEIAWVVALLDELPRAEVLSLHVEPGDLKVVGGRIPMLDVHIHAASWSDGLVLANALGLRELDGRTTDGFYGQSLWRDWSGWAAEASHQLPVQVLISASELESELPTLFDGAVS